MGEVEREDQEVEGHDSWEYYVREGFNDGGLREDHDRIHEYKLRI